MTEIDILHGTIAPMYALFEETGKFLAGRVMSATDSSFHIELDSGKRVKVKAANVLLQFEQPTPSQLIADAQNLCKTMDAALAWECSPEDEFSFAELAQDYFNDKPSAAQQAAALFCLFDAPHYFRRAGKGRFKKAAPEIVQQALLAIEKKKQVLLQISEWAQALASGQCPASIKEQLFKILFKPDKNAAEYKAVVEAARSSNTPPLLLLQKLVPLHQHTNSTGSDFYLIIFLRAQPSLLCKRLLRLRTCQLPKSPHFLLMIRRPRKLTMLCRYKGSIPEQSLLAFTLLRPP